MNKLRLSLVLSILLAGGWPGLEPAARAQLNRAGKIEPRDFYDPRPAPGDAALPLPCGLKMLLRPAAVPVKGRLGDLPAKLGLYGRPDGFYSDPFFSYLAAPLTLADLPEAYRAEAAKALDQGGEDFQIYLIGKYEVTAAQYEAVMGSCPSGAGPELAAPKTSLSWFEAVAFSEKYTAWLLENAPEYLPRFAGDERNVGFLRLPTEEEWEYAARGGHKVSGLSLTQDFFPAEGLGEKDFGAFNDGVSPPENAPVRIGRYQPNPLGLYDTVGNAAEMTFDMFRLSLSARRHGSPGGFVRKGGSFLSGLSEVRPGDRKEIAFFNREGPVRARDLGFRLVLSAVNVSRAGEKALREEYARLGENPGLALGSALTEAADPMGEIDKLIAQAGTTADQKAVLEELRPFVKNYAAIVEQNAAAALNAQVQSVLYGAYGLRSTSRRRNLAADLAELAEYQIRQAQTNMELARSPADKAEYKKAIALFFKRRDDYRQDVADFEDALNNQFSYYQGLLEEARKADPQALRERIEAVGRELKGRDSYQKEMRACFEFIKRDLDLALRGRIDQIKRSDLEIPLKK